MPKADTTMLCIDASSTDPYFNLATEEYLLKEFQEDIFMLWRNEPSIIVGKHQNTLAEINLDFVKEKGIKVVRRLSGGGTVFHDLGNLNFTFIMSSDGDHKVDFRKYTAPILEVLQQKLGIDARFEGRNDLCIEGRKFSGNAEHVHKNRVLHHGTLLFSSVMTDLTAALKADPDKFHDKAVKSVRSRVTNISEHLSEPMDILDFRDIIMSHIFELYPDSTHYVPGPADKEKISSLRDGKYASWEWNFGYSPEYNFQRSIRTAGGKIEFRMDVQGGYIRNISIYGDYFSTRDTDDIAGALKGVRHNDAAIRDALAGYTIEEYFSNVGMDEFVRGMF